MVWNGVCGICTKVFKYQPIQPIYESIGAERIRYDKSRSFHQYQKHKLLTHWKELEYVDFEAAEKKWKDLVSGFSEVEKHELEMDELDGLDDMQNDE